MLLHILPSWALGLPHTAFVRSYSNVVRVPVRAINKSFAALPNDGAGVNNIADSCFEAYPQNKKSKDIMHDDKETYDYILVGGGAAACVLAYKLDKMGYNVLVMERGPHPDEVADSRHVNGWPACWNSYGAKEMVYDDGKITIVGNTIGGGTTINVGVTWEETPSFFSENLGPKCGAICTCIVLSHTCSATGYIYVPNHMFKARSSYDHPN